ncbi:MAG: type II CRISPR RNA-guided endonuclease Cas9 [Bacilli bacterium]|jgi:CRISPR-associated endonuclease Csn1
MARKIVLGLDIGVGSVGWGLIDKESGKIIDKGVRLFSEAAPENNVGRRNNRHLRRSIRRKEFRLYRARRVLLEMGIIDDISATLLDNPYEIRAKGLKQKLTKQELAAAILHLMKRNGFRYDVADDEDESGVKRISEEYLCQHQLAILQKSGKVRGHDNKYHFSLYEKEFKKLLDVQAVSEKYKQKLLEIFAHRRDYSEGPGSATSPTEYGRFLSFNAEPINLIEKMRGHCSIYPDELRAPKICPSSEYFNLLNDFNNLNVDGKKLTEEQKTEIIETFILGKGEIKIKQLAEYLGVSDKKINVLRVDKKGKPILTPFTSILKINAATEKFGLPSFIISSTDDFELLDRVFEILTQTKNIDERYAKIKEQHLRNISDDMALCLAHLSGITGYHSLSLKAIRELSNEMLVSNLNSQQIIVTKSRDDDTKIELKVSKDAVISPVVVKSVNQTFKIVRAILKRYGKLDSVVIEMARDKNSEEEKDAIKSAQEAHLKEKNEVLELLSANNKSIDDLNGDIFTKIILYKEQHGKSIYSGKPIELNVLIEHPEYFEIDHVIPYSVSLDDSRSNKVLVYASENQTKGQRTPYQVFREKPQGWYSFEEYEAFVRSSYTSRKKIAKLMFKDDISLSKVREEFINRNLNDTRYACRMVLDVLKKYFRQHKYETTVNVINGATTSKVRYMGKLPKNRDMYCHHAIDALIIASFRKSKYLANAFDAKYYDEEMGVFLLSEKEVEKEIYGDVLKSIVEQVRELDPINDFKFSYKIDTKANRQIADAHIYGTRIIDGNLCVIKKYENIYDKWGIKLAKRIRDNKDIDKIFMAKNDPNTFAVISKVVSLYPDEKNPFASFKKEHGDFIRKYRKNGVGPVVISVRYLEDKVNLHLDVTNKYAQQGSTVIKLQLSPYRMDLYRSKETGKFKFITVRYVNVRYKSDINFIDREWYEAEMKENQISSDYIFVNSFYRGDLIKRTFNDGTIKLDVFINVNNPVTQQFELHYYGKATTEEKENHIFKTFQYMQTFTKDTAEVEKYSTDILGKRYKVVGEKLKLQW